MDELGDALLAHVEQAVFVLEADAQAEPVYVAMSAYALKALGKTPAQVIGRTAREVYSGKMGQRAYDLHQHAFQSGKPVNYEITLTIGGKERHIRTHLQPQLDADGRIVRIIGNSVDMTESHKLDGIKEEAETIAGEMRNFVNLAAHDLRAPIRNVTRIADMLREGFVDMGDGKLELIDMLEGVGVKAMTLIGDVLSHSHIDPTRKEHILFDVGAVMSDVRGMLDPMQLHVIACPSVMVESDQTALQIVLRNLLDNAIKYSKPETFDESRATAPLEFRIEVSEPEDGVLEVTVTDNGAGFSDEALERLERGESRLDSGFGLLGVRRLLEARGGRLEVGNNPHGTGTVVTFSLPGNVPCPRQNRSSAAWALAKAKADMSELSKLR